MKKDGSAPLQSINPEFQRQTYTQSYDYGTATSAQPIKDSSNTGAAGVHDSRYYANMSSQPSAVYNESQRIENAHAPRQFEEKPWKYAHKIPLDISNFPHIVHPFTLIEAIESNQMRFLDEAGCYVQLRGNGVSQAVGNLACDEPLHLIVKYDQVDELNQVNSILESIIRNCDKRFGQPSSVSTEQSRASPYSSPITQPVKMMGGIDHSSRSATANSITYLPSSFSQKQNPSNSYGFDHNQFPESRISGQFSQATSSTPSPYSSTRPHSTTSTFNPPSSIPSSPGAGSIPMRPTQPTFSPPDARPDFAPRLSHSSGLNYVGDISLDAVQFLYLLHQLCHIAVEKDDDFSYGIPLSYVPSFFENQYSRQFLLPRDFLCRTNWNVSLDPCERLFSILRSYDFVFRIESNENYSATMTGNKSYPPTDASMRNAVRVRSLLHPQLQFPDFRRFIQQNSSSANEPSRPAENKFSGNSSFQQSENNPIRNPDISKRHSRPVFRSQSSYEGGAMQNVHQSEVANPSGDLDDILGPPELDPSLYPSHHQNHEQTTSSARPESRNLPALQFQEQDKDITKSANLLHMMDSMNQSGGRCDVPSTPVLLFLQAIHRLLVIKREPLLLRNLENSFYDFWDLPLSSEMFGEDDIYRFLSKFPDVVTIQKSTDDQLFVYPAKVPDFKLVAQRIESMAIPSIKIPNSKIKSVERKMNQTALPDSVTTDKDAGLSPDELLMDNLKCIESLIEEVEDIIRTFRRMYKINDVGSVIPSVPSNIQMPQHMLRNYE